MRKGAPGKDLRLELWFERLRFRYGKAGKRLEVKRQPKSKTHFVLFADVLGSGQGMIREPNINAKVLGLMPFMAHLFPAGENRPGDFHVPVEHLILVQLHHVLNELSEDFYPWQIIAFSDSAYVVFDRPEDAAHFAGRLMVNLQRERIPARMGIGAGTFATIRFDRQEAVGRNYYAAQFAGSGIVHAYQAESKGGKGLRVFVHPSAARNFSHNGNVSWFTKRLPKPTEHASHEINYTWLGLSRIPTADANSARVRVRGISKTRNAC